MEEDRRVFLKSLGMAALAPLLGVAPAAALPASAAGPGLAVTALGGAFLVNGWILSKADLAALGIHAD